MMWRVFAMICLLAQPLYAVEPKEVLDDPLLEQRARSISAGLRCLQCRNESIDESNAEIARDLRLLVRARLVAGDSDTEVIDYVVARYGEYVLLRPNGIGANIVLWAAGPLLFLCGLFAAVLLLRRQPAGVADTKPLAPEEEAALRELLIKERHSP